MNKAAYNVERANGGGGTSLRRPDGETFRHSTANTEEKVLTIVQSRCYSYKIEGEGNEDARTVFPLDL